MKYDYECNECGEQFEECHDMDLDPTVKCPCCSAIASKVFLSAPGVVVPPQHQSSADKARYYGIKNTRTGEGITRHTNVQDPCGIRVKRVK